MKLSASVMKQRPVEIKNNLRQCKIVETIPLTSHRNTIADRLVASMHRHNSDLNPLILRI